MELADLLETGAWTSAPVAVRLEGAALTVEAREGSDAWRTTSYGFIHDDAHALVAPFGAEAAIEVSWVLDYDAQFDQAGVMLRVDAETWIKAGVEVSDGVAQVGAVVTHGRSDWSVAPVPEWAGREVTVRASRSGDAVTVRARVEGEPWRLVRVAPLDPDATVLAGPFCCAPTRAGLVVTFTGVRVGEPDAALHPEP
ncbi:DUF1349 domain-containing protein [Demequina subtropica]|uniref:DUF1349 domain-containing protein n=1 Tax=Demequina subtropica TaxID=1638989 RepID=UPI0009E4CC7E|nr:DUF1349 domain-containing protein [Demequina subtropica]